MERKTNQTSQNDVYLDLGNLIVYQLSRKLTSTAWKIYEDLSQDIKYHAGGQFLDATDSVGANIAEGYGRFHYLDKIKFYYNARGSLIESRHWFEILSVRDLVKNKKYKEEYLDIYQELRPRLNSFIKASYVSKASKK